MEYKYFLADGLIKENIKGEKEKQPNLLLNFANDTKDSSWIEFSNKRTKLCQVVAILSTTYHLPRTRNHFPVA